MSGLDKPSSREKSKSQKVIAERPPKNINELPLEVTIKSYKPVYNPRKINHHYFCFRL